MRELRLPMLPDRTPVKLTVHILPDLSQALAEYAAAYEQAYGKAESVNALVPHMLWSFLDSDRGFSRSRRK